MRKILLIDDDRDDIELFKEALEEVEPSVSFQHFENAQTAFQKLLTANDDLPSLIFLDINLPVVSGWDFLQQIREVKKLSRIPVIMYTTSSYSKEKEKALRMGAQSFVSKPNDFDALKSLLKEELDKHLVWQ
jgi:CheY-like chemotaxis protein